MNIGAWTAADWDAFGSVLSGGGTLLGAVAVIWAARLASNTYEGWRKQKLAERRIDQAERILTATYQARRALNHVRSPMMWAHELHAAEEHLAKKDFWQTLDTKRKTSLTSAQAYFNRINAVKDERLALDECLPMARALFGEEIEAALDELNHQFHVVGVAADMIADHDDDREFAQKLRSDLSSSSSPNRPNEMNEIIAAKVKLIENAMLPILRLDVGHG